MYVTDGIGVHPRCAVHTEGLDENSDLLPVLKRAVSERRQSQIMSCQFAFERRRHDYRSGSFFCTYALYFINFLASESAMTSLTESRHAFEARAREVGLADEDIASLTGSGITSLVRLAFCSGAAGSSADK